MPSFSQRSEHQLTTCDLQLQTLFRQVIVTFDCTIIEGHRPIDRQLDLYHSGRSKVRHGKHNHRPAQAVDAAPWLQGRGIPWPQTPTDWNNSQQRNQYIKDLAHFYYFAGFVMDCAEQLGIRLRWGGDWDRDHDLHDQSFDDLVHFELLVGG